MTWQWVFSIVAGTIIWELTLGMWVWPDTTCPCKGRLPSCPWCHGTGRHTRYVRQWFDAMIRKAMAS